jgi:uncharacterized DUF497 family protein
MKQEFEWDVEKAEANSRRHGVGFEQAVKAFFDPFAVERIDDREDYGEERVNLVAMCEGSMLQRDLYRARRPHPDHLCPKGETT